MDNYRKWVVIGTVIAITGVTFLFYSNYKKANDPIEERLVIFHNGDKMNIKMFGTPFSNDFEMNMVNVYPNGDSISQISQFKGGYLTGRSDHFDKSIVSLRSSYWKVMTIDDVTFSLQSSFRLDDRYKKDSIITHHLTSDLGDIYIFRAFSSHNSDSELSQLKIDSINPLITGSRLNFVYYPMPGTDLAIMEFYKEGILRIIYSYRDADYRFYNFYYRIIVRSESELDYLRNVFFEQMRTITINGYRPWPFIDASPLINRFILAP